MTKIIAETYIEDGQPILKLSWYDERMRRNDSKKVGMDKEAIEDLIGKLTDLKGKV